MSEEIQINHGSISVVIPTLNAAPFLPLLANAFSSQEGVAPMEVILVDSGSTDGTQEMMEQYPNWRVISIERFSHGRSRNLGAREAKGDLIVILSQDAIPAYSSWLTELIKPFSDPQVAATFSRQVPKPGANPMEQYFLQSHFPEGEPLRMQKKPDEPFSFQRGIFFSNVTAAIRRDILLEYPFDEKIIMSEDQQFARDVMNAGYAVVYTPSSVVLHSHNYTLNICFRRYFDSVYSLTQIFADHNCSASVSLGLRYVFKECGYILRRHPLYFPYYILYNMAKTAGTLAAHMAGHMPRWMLRKCSLHRYYWDQKEQKSFQP